MLTSTIATLRTMNASRPFKAQTTDHRLCWISHAKDCPLLATDGPDVTRDILMMERTRDVAEAMANRLNRHFGCRDSTSSRFEVRRIR